MSELISVVLPVYNGEEYLAEAIESILKQTYANFEFIIINDGSKDNSADVIRKYVSNDDRITYIDRENKGLIATLNEAIELSKGSYIARMDQDDISFKDRLELQYNYMKSHNLDICGGDYIEIDQSGAEIAKRKVFKKDYEILLTLASNVPFAHPSVMIKKSFLVPNNIKYGIDGYREAEDLDLWLNMYTRGAKFGNVDSIILKYRVLPTSMSRINHKKIMKEANRQFDMFMKKNKKQFKQAFEIFFTKKINSKELEIVAMKASLRYALIHFDFILLYKFIQKVSVKNFLLGTLSFLKLKFS